MLLFGLSAPAYAGGTGILDTYIDYRDILLFVLLLLALPLAAQDTPARAATGGMTDGVHVRGDSGSKNLPGHQPAGRHAGVENEELRTRNEEL